MKIALIGYGRMGRLIGEIAESRGNKISCIIDKDDTHLYSSKEFRESDVAIEFSVPSCAVEGILACFAAKVPVVVGTTGWTDSLSSIEEMCRKGEGTMLFSSNFSIGMNIFMALNRFLADAMNEFASYNPSMKEIHHIHKLDHPSGTAVTLANELVAKLKRLTGWKEPEGHSLPADLLPVDYERTGEVPGTHIISWDSPCDSITIRHDAKNRSGFAEGAVTAAEWLAGRKGLYSMADMLSDVTKTTGLFI